MRRIARAGAITSTAPARSPRARRRPANSCRPPRSPSTTSASAKRALHVVGHEHARAPRRAPDQRLQQLGGRGVEARAGLVEQHQRRVVQHGARHRQPLHHAAREVAQRLVGAPLHAHRRQQLLHPRRRRPSAAARGSAGSRGRSARGRAAARGPGSPRGRAPASARRAARRRAPGAPRRAGAAGRQHPQQRGLAGAVGAQHRQGLAPSGTLTVTPVSATRSP